MKIIIIFLLLSMILQLLFLPTLCGIGTNEARFEVAIIIDILIPLRLLYKPTKVDKNFYLIILLTSFIWIHLFIYEIVLFLVK